VLHAQHGYTLIGSDDFEEFVRTPGTALLLFADDPAKVPECWDITIILPELLAGLGTSLRVGLISPDVARPLASRYDIRIWPALLALRDGGYLGSIEGLKDWAVYARLLPELLAAEPSRVPGIGIPVRVAGSPGGCH
jgi:hydrogenase-1 operon protein HyaE